MSSQNTKRSSRAAFRYFIFDSLKILFSEYDDLRNVVRKASRNLKDITGLRVLFVVPTHFSISNLLLPSMSSEIVRWSSWYKLNWHDTLHSENKTLLGDSLRSLWRSFLCASVSLSQSVVIRPEDFVPLRYKPHVLKGQSSSSRRFHSVCQLFWRLLAIRCGLS